MRKWRVISLVLLCGAALSGALSAAAETISYSAARELILRRNAGLKSAEAEVEAAKAGVDRAGSLPDPSLGIALDNFGRNEIEATVEQTVELGGKRRGRTAAARAELDGAQNEARRTKAELDAEIARRFIPIDITARKIALVDSAIEVARKSESEIRRRIEAGAGRKTDMLRAQVEIERLRLERSEFERQQMHAKKDFVALGGADDRTLLQVTGTINDALFVPPLDTLRNALARSPRLADTDIEARRLAAEQTQLRAEATPDLNLSAGYLHNSAENTGSPLVGLSLNLPLFGRNAAARTAQGFRAQAVRERREGTMRLLDAQLQQTHSRLLEIDRKIEALGATTIPKAEQVLETMLEYYWAGSAGFLDLAAAQSEVLDLQMELLDTQAERAGALADLMATVNLQLDIVK